MEYGEEALQLSLVNWEGLVLIPKAFLFRLIS